MAAPKVPALDVWDVLSMLPQDVVSDNIWWMLSHADGHSLRLASKAGRRFVDSLTTAVTLDISDFSGQHMETKWRAEQTACLSHLPGLQGLALVNWTTLDHVTVALLACHGATHGRLTYLRLDEVSRSAMEGNNTSAWTAAGSQFLSVSFPGLTALELTTPNGIAARELLPLAGLTCLTKLVLPSVGTRRHPAPPLFHHMSTTLTGLQHLAFVSALGNPSVAQSLVDVSSLFGLTALTHLEVQTLTHVSTADDVDMDDPNAPLCAPGPLAAALASLATMTRLCCLRTCPDQVDFDFIVDDAVFAAIQQLTCLTELMVSKIRLTAGRALATSAPLAGNLPALEVLGVDACMSPSELLNTLLPLLPLPSLRRLGQTSSVSDLCLMTGPVADSGIWVCSRESVALAQLARHLASAPKFHVDRLQLAPFNAASRRDHACIASTLKELRPLLADVEFLQFDDRFIDVPHLTDAVDWMPKVDKLSLVSCELTDVALAAIGALLPTLDRLDVFDDTGNTNISSNGWLALATFRNRPLHVEVDGSPTLTPELVEQCRALQQRRFGTQHITWRIIS